MADIKTERDEYLTRLENRTEQLQSRFEAMMREATRDNDMETLARVERAKKSIAEKGEALDTVMEEASGSPEDEWDGVRERLDGAWREYREAVERAELELERAEELS